MDLRKEFLGAYTVWYREVLRFFTDRSRIFGAIAQPVLFLAVLGGGISSAINGLSASGGPLGAAAANLGSGFNYLAFLFPGILGMSVLFTSIMSAISIVWDREFGFLKEVLVAPVSRTSVAIGKIAGGSTVAMAQGALILLLSPLVGVKVSVLEVVSLLLLMLLLAAVMSSLGLLIASRQKTMEGFQVIMQFVILPMLFLSGAFFPLTKGSWVTTIARFIPVTYGVDALRQTVLPASVMVNFRIAPVGFEIAVLFGFFVLFLVPAVILFSKQD
jgi:ABC-2 type transport system permease protein